MEILKVFFIKKVFDELKSGFSRSDLGYFLSKLTPRKFLNLLNSYVARKLGFFFFPPRPVTLFIEIVNGCNFNCVGCQAGTLFKKSFMKFDDFKKILNAFPDAIFIYPYGVGESFLHRDIYDMIKYAVQKGFIVLPFSNFSVISAEKLVSTGIRKIFASIDTFDREKFSLLRSGGNINIVVKNIMKVQEEKKKRNIPYPEICINTTIMKENIDDCEDIILNGLKLGISSFYFQTLFTADFLNPSTHPPDKSDIQKIKFLKKKYKNKAKIYLISHYNYEMGDYFFGFCQFAFSALFISSNGETYPCICGTTPEKRNGEGIFGNIYKESINSVIYRRTNFLIDFRKSVPEWCKGCPIYYREC